MGNFINVLIILLFQYAKIIQSYPYGAPSSVCSSMTPSHGVGSTSCTSIFVIESSKSDFANTESIQSQLIYDYYFILLSFFWFSYCSRGNR